MTSEPDHRITLAVLAAKLDAMLYEMRESFDRLDRDNCDHEKRIRTTEKAITRIEQQQGIVAGLLTLLSVAGNAIAAWIGSKP
jgi:hypothetical protein